MTPVQPGPPQMSREQQRMWFLAKAHPQSSALNLGIALHVVGALDLDVLDAAIRDAAERFPVITATYTLDAAGEPRPVTDGVVTGLVNQWTVSEPAGGPPAASEPVRVLIRREFGHVFDVEREPPVRVSVIRLTAERHVLVVVAHRIAWDEGCWGGYFGALTDAYRRVSQGIAGDVAAGADPFADLTAASDVRLVPIADPPEPIEFPGETTGGRVPRTDSAMTETVLSVAQTVALDRLARRAGTDLAAVLLTAFQIVVTRACRAEELLIALGNVAAAAVLRGRVDERRRLGELVSQVAADARAAQRHSAGDPLVRLRFARLRPPATLFAPPGGSATILTSHTGHTDVPLSLAYEIRDTAAGRECVLRLEYQVDVIQRAVADAMTEQTVCVLTRFTDDALTRPIGDLPVLPDRARNRVLAMSRGAEDHTAPTTLPELFAHQVRTRPRAHAVVTDTGAITYRELDALSDLAADRLAAQGIRAGSRVACVLPPSADLVVAALAAVKLGAVYLPIDPAQPEEHIAHIVGDARPAVVIGPRDDLAAGKSPHRPPRRPGGGTGPRPEYPAYVIYTSASTGQPKGVLVPHRAITEYLGWILRSSGLGAGDSVLQVASPGFDASIGEIFGCLASGARLVIPRETGLTDVGYLTGLLREHDITSMHLVPSQLAAFLARPAVERWTSLHWVPVGGEALPGALADRFNATFDARLSHFYGPTEATLAVSRYEVAVAQGQRTVPIGTPKDNTQVYVLDDRLRLVDIGVVGEIYVGGGQLALGYLGQPSPTAARFVADPFTQGGRLYRTGDLGRWSPDGVLEFLGRAEEQVRLHGSRIEFGKIESVVARAADVAQCVVTLDDHPTRGRRLIAHVVLPGGGPLSPDAEHRIQRAAAASLPSHLVPQRIVGIDAIPLTRNGKLDRDALLGPLERSVTAARKPAAATERRLCAMFAELTGAAEVAVNDSFFDLGGHPLLAARLLGRVRAEFGVDLPVDTLSERPTPAALAERLDLARVTARRVPARIPAARSGTGPAPGDFSLASGPKLSVRQTDILDGFAGDGPGPTDNVVFGVQVRGPLDRSALESALGDLLARHDILRTTYGRDADGVCRPRVHPAPTGGGLRVSTSVAGDDVAAMWRAAVRRIDVGRELPVQAELVVQAPDRALVLLVVHHVAADRWSMPVLAADLATAYRARATGAAPQWPPYPMHHGEFALWQRSLAAGEHAAHWARELQIPVARGSDAARRGRPAVDHVRLAPDPVLRSMVESLAGLAGSDERSVLLAAVGRLLGPDAPILWMAAPDGVPSTVEGTVGPLVHHIPVRIDAAAVAAEPVPTVRGIYERVMRGLNHLGRPVLGPPERVVVAFGRPDAPSVRVGPAGPTTMVPLAPVHPASTTDLTFDIWPGVAGLEIDITFRTDRYRRDAVAGLGQRLADMLTPVRGELIGSTAGKEHHG
ncbi:amino acid adenylation domain-containing protein [Dactylosporangium sp. NPDC005572]|uniref:non-ribosomal peptide synthetase n=1 Tax=Dactylosporangium sp. NPDC005572 TaxID=3156889 RepID=UPI0033AE4150